MERGISKIKSFQSIRIGDFDGRDQIPIKINVNPVGRELLEFLYP